MLSPTAIMPEELIDPGRRTDAVNWILAQPFESRLKVRLFKGWLRSVGQTATRDEYTTIEDSGIER